MRKLFLSTASALLLCAPAVARTEMTFWHGMGDTLGAATHEIAEMFNASPSEHRVVPLDNGTYEEPLTATIAAFRVGEQPNIVQVFDAGAATVIGAEGATIAAPDLLAQFGSKPFSPDDYIAGVRNFYVDADGKMIGMPFNSPTPILSVSTEAFEKTGLTPPATWEEFEAMAPALAEAG